MYELAYASTADTAYIPSQYNATRVTRTVTLDKTSFSLIQLNAGWVTVTGLNASLRDFRPHVLTLRCGGASGRQRGSMAAGLCVVSALGGMRRDGAWRQLHLCCSCRSCCGPATPPLVSTGQLAA